MNLSLFYDLPAVISIWCQYFPIPVSHLPLSLRPPDILVDPVLFVPLSFQLLFSWGLLLNHSSVPSQSCWLYYFSMVDFRIWSTVLRYSISSSILLFHIPNLFFCVVPSSRRHTSFQYLMVSLHGHVSPPPHYTLDVHPVAMYTKLPGQDSVRSAVLHPVKSILDFRL